MNYTRKVLRNNNDKIEKWKTKINEKINKRKYQNLNKKKINKNKQKKLIIKKQHQQH